MKLPTVLELAREFVRLLNEAGTPDQVRLAAAANKSETDSAVCHSHDFCDANQVMDDAFQNLTGKTTAELSVGRTPSKDVPCMSDEVEGLWNDAWLLAREKDFSLAAFGYGTPEVSFEIRQQISSDEWIYPDLTDIDCDSAIFGSEKDAFIALAQHLVSDLPAGKKPNWKRLACMYDVVRVEVSKASDEFRLAMLKQVEAEAMEDFE